MSVDAVALETIYNAVNGTDAATTDTDGVKYPTDADLADATGLDRGRVLSALAVMAFSETARPVRRGDGAVGWGPVSRETTTESAESTQ